MSQYAQLPSGLIMPHELAQTAISNYLFGNAGAYRSASSRNKNTAAWSTADGSADTDTLTDLATLRRQSRDLVRNEALPAGVIGTMDLGVVGQGIIPQARIDSDYLNLTADQAAEWERAAERIFNHVANKPTFDSECKLNFWQQQRLIYRSKLESGDCIAVRRYIKRKGKLLGVSIQLVEADRLATPIAMQDDDKVRSGIELGDNGEPVNYHIMQSHPAEKLEPETSFTKIPAYDKNGDPLVLHIVTRLRPGQTRGVPHLAPVIELFKQLGRYTEAEIAAAVVSGMFAIMVTSPAPVGPLGTAMAGIPGMVPSNTTASKAPGFQEMRSGMIVDLAPGEDIKVAEATRPNTAFEPFVNACLSSAGAALGIPSEVLLKRYNTSYSAARAAIMDAYRQFLVERDDMVYQFCQPVWSWVITEAVAAGLLDAPGFFEDPLARDAWLGTEWIGAPAPSIDPTKDAAAEAAWHALGIKSKQDICASQGRDFDSTLKQRAKEKNAEDKNGLTVLLPGQVDPKNSTTPKGAKDAQQ